MSDGICFIGHVEEQSMDAHSFIQQQRTFAVHGYALNPSALAGDPSTAYVGDLSSAAQNNFSLIENIRTTHSSRRENKRKRQNKGDAGVVDGDGAYLGPWASWEGEKEEGVEEVEEDMEEWRAEKRKRDEAQEASREKMKKAGEEKSIFHGELVYSSRLVTTRVLILPQQENRLPTMLAERICISQPISVSTSNRTKILQHQRVSSLKTVFILG
jgi:hypothetical protein